MIDNDKDRPDDDVIGALEEEIAALGVDAQPERRAVGSISYALGLIIRLWGINETTARLSRLQLMLKNEECSSVVENTICGWAGELSFLFQ